MALSSDGLLRGSLRANAIFSFVSGAGMFIADGLVAALLGTFDAVGLVSLAGLGVFFFGAFVLWLSTRRPVVPPGLAKLVIGGDAAWVVGSWLLIGSGVLSTQGVWAVAIVADIVLLFGVLQWLGLRRTQAGSAAAPA